MIMYESNLNSGKLTMAFQDSQPSHTRSVGESIDAITSFCVIYERKRHGIIVLAVIMFYISWVGK